MKSKRGISEHVEVRIGLHQGSALSPFLFIMLVDRSQDVRTELPWELLYADDQAEIDIISTDTQNRLESWQKVLTDNGLKINVATTEHLSTRETPLPMKLNGELKNVDHFKYLGSVIEKDGTIDRDVYLRVQAAWSSWRKLTGRFFSGSKQMYMRPLSDRLYDVRERMLGNECDQQEKDYYNGDEDASRDPRSVETRPRETRKSDAYYTFNRSTRLCAVAVFVGLDMSRDEMQTTLHAE